MKTLNGIMKTVAFSSPLWQQQLGKTYEKGRTGGSRNIAAGGEWSKAQEGSLPSRSSDGQSSAYTELPCLPQWARF